MTLRTGETVRLASRIIPMNVATRLMYRNLREWLLKMRRPMNRTSVRIKTRTAGIQRATPDVDPYVDPTGTQELQRQMLLQNRLLLPIVSCQQHGLECRLEAHETLTQDRRVRYECCQP